MKTNTNIYSIMAAAVIDEEKTGPGRLKEMVMETNRGSHYQVFTDKAQAKAWLASSN